jgi:O-antigen/teichoic acid export membrane protein
MIGFIGTDSEVGLYNAALKVKSIVLALSTSVTAVIVPRMSYYLQNNFRDSANKLLEKSVQVSFLVSVPTAVYIYIFAEKCLLFFCGSGYLGAVNTLRILMICIIPLILTNLLGNQILIPSGQEKRYSQSVFVGMWINLILNIVLIPFMGAFGAALGTLVTECRYEFFGSKFRMSSFWTTCFCRDYFLWCILSVIVASKGTFISATGQECFE